MLGLGWLVTTAAMEDYLKAIYRLQDPADGVSTKALADALDVTAASATNMVKRLAELELVNYEPYQGAQLTGPGEAIALEVIRHHRLLELFLVETLGLSWDQVHEEAEVLEHHISERLEARIAEMLGHPERDPHGDPIPSLDGSVRADGGQALPDAEPGSTLQVVRVTDQRPDVLRFLADNGLVPKAHLHVDRVEPSAGVIEIRVDGQAIHLGMEVAAAVRVTEVT